MCVEEGRCFGPRNGEAGPSMGGGGSHGWRGKPSVVRGRKRQQVDEVKPKVWDEEEELRPEGQAGPGLGRTLKGWGRV